MLHQFQLVEIDYQGGKHLGEFIGEGTRIHNNQNVECFIFLIHTYSGIVEYSIPKREISTKLENKEIISPTSRTINKYKKQLKRLQKGTISVGGILEKLGKVNQNIYP